MSSKRKTARMTKGGAVANPPVKDIPIWENKGWTLSPDTVPERGDENAQTEE